MKFIGIIPARYASTRFPGKPLADICGKAMIERVYLQVKMALDDVCVATDDERIAGVVRSFGGNVVMTSAEHRSGTDRCYEAYCNIKSDADVVVNIQGDEPFINPRQITELMGCFDDPSTQIATLVRPFDPALGIDALINPNTPKVVFDQNRFALYFSRSVIPYVRGSEQAQWTEKASFFTHIGMYAYRADVLKQITSLPQSPLELAESLEQLRWLQNGYKIKVGVNDCVTIGIDTPADLERACQLFVSGKI